MRTLASEAWSRLTQVCGSPGSVGLQEKQSNTATASTRIAAPAYSDRPARVNQCLEHPGFEPSIGARRVEEGDEARHFGRAQLVGGEGCEHALEVDAGDPRAVRVDHEPDRLSVRDARGDGSPVRGAHVPPRGDR